MRVVYYPHIKRKRQFAKLTLRKKKGEELEGTRGIDGVGPRSENMGL